MEALRRAGPGGLDPWHHPPRDALEHSSSDTKGRGGLPRGIGLREPIWKVLEQIMDRRLDAIELHDCLHGCRQRGDRSKVGATALVP